MWSKSVKIYSISQLEMLDACWGNLQLPRALGSKLSRDMEKLYLTTNEKLLNSACTSAILLVLVFGCLLPAQSPGRTTEELPEAVVL